MSESDDETSSYLSGFITPPLSPSKTVDTDGWFSPRTPGSPRKTRSCLFTRKTHPGADSHLFTPPNSPIKSKPTFQLGALAVPEVLHATPESNSPHPDNDSPTKRFTHMRVDTSYPTSPVSLALARSCTFPSPDVPGDARKNSDIFWEAGSVTPHSEGWPAATRRSSHRSVSDSQVSAVTRASSATLEHEVFGSCVESRGSWAEEGCSAAPHSAPPTYIQRFPLRSSSSPLRSSQWATRGGLSPTLRRHQACTPDRYIASRRPPAITRESFELNKPEQRREANQITRGGQLNADPFSRNLRRTGRLNDELHGLRESHSILRRRASANRRNASLLHRRHSLAGSRQISAGAVWNVGGPSAVSDTVAAVSTGRGGMLGTGTNAPLYTSTFLSRADPEAELEAYERRLALALDVNQSDRILQHLPLPATLCNPMCGDMTPCTKHTWRDNAWIKDGVISLLDAPQLRDDYYCTLLAYSHSARCLAVGLGNFVHLWSERSGVDTPQSLNAAPTTSVPDVQHVTSLDFSSAQGSQAILAVGRADGRVTLWSPFDSEPRFDATQPKPISCVSWRPTTILRPSLRDRAMTVVTEELIIGDEVGHIYFYSIEWPSENQSALFGWHGAMTLLARMVIHTQQICGLAWASDGELFASGGNDNNCFLFETKKVLRAGSANATAALDVRQGPNGESIYIVSNGSGSVLHLQHTTARHKWTLNAAVKAMAFCPWQRGLLAVGGGSNDRCIHFYHTRSGTCLATIDCAAQVTSLVWSQTRREIAATFGFAQPEHPYRIAVFAWPSCEQVVSIPWWDESRALCAVAYPGGPSSTPASRDDHIGNSTRNEEGCLVVAASDMAIRFHEIWGNKRGSTSVGGLVGSGTSGSLGGSDILEGLHGIMRDASVIR